MKKILIIFLALVIALLLPLLFKQKNNRFVVGPKLSECSYTEVNFNNVNDGTSLAGMFFKPQLLDSFPIAVLIHGSGTSSRDNAWYLTFAKYLQENGIGVLLPDKRGSEKSEGEWVGATLETLATDTQSALHFLRNHPTYNRAKVGVIGLSQGGWIAPIVAEQNKDLSFVVNVSASMTTTDEQLEFEEFHNIAPYTYNFIAKLVSPQTAGNIKKKNNVAPLMGFDPVPFWKNVHAPVFIAYGDGDTNCPVERSIKIINTASLSHFKTKIYYKGGHGILDVKTHRVNSIFLNDLKEFIKEATQ